MPWLVFAKGNKKDPLLFPFSLSHLQAGEKNEG
jgi:hypothetical protein